MKKLSFFLLFAIFGLLSVSNSSLPNCKSKSSDGSTCYQCYPGYTLISGNCSCMIPNCDRCQIDFSNNTVCGQCSTYFGNRGADLTTCDSCYLDGCWNCSLNTLGNPICQNCSKGYLLQDDKCVLCSDISPGCGTCDFVNGSFRCQSCIARDAFYSDGLKCVSCGSEGISKNCQMCENYGDDSANYSGYCYLCQEGFTPVNNNTQFCISCNISNCKSCSGFSNYCNQCNDGYSWNDSSKSCIACNITNCSSCSAGNCDVCNLGYFKNGTGHCVLCSDYGTIVSNCIEPSCYNSSNVINQQCKQCNASFYSEDSALTTCSKCSDILSNCISCYYSWSHLINKGYHLCSKCDPGYYLQFLTDNITYVCTKNCSSRHTFDSTLNMCIPCTELFGNGCSSCNKTQCFSCDSSFYNLVHTEQNLSCSQCTSKIEAIVNISNVSLCLRRSNSNISNFTTSNKSANLDVSCSIASSKIYFAYGPATSLQSVTLTMIQKKIDSTNNTNIPSTADTMWIGYGVRKQNGTQSTNVMLIPPLKQAGENYRLTVWCQSAVNTSDVSSISQDWTQPNNGGIKTKISFVTNATLNSTQKKLLGVAVRKTLNINRDMYTDDGLLVPQTMENLGNSRILNEARILANNSTISFVILPDYTADLDQTSTFINQTLLSNSSTFVQNVTTLWNTLFPNNTIQLYNATAIATGSIPAPILSNVDISMNGNSLTLKFNLTNTDGKFYAGVDTTTWGLQYANLSTSNITYPTWSQFVQGYNSSLGSLTKFSNISTTAGQSSSLTLAGLDNNKTFMVYYGASNNDIPPVYTSLYVNVTNTITSGGGGNGSGSGRLYAWFGLLVLILIW